MSLAPVNVGILGLGTVGMGTVQVLANNTDEISRRAGRRIEISIAATRTPSKVQADIGHIVLGDDPFAVVNHPDVEVVIELIGGYEPARELVLQAIANRKHVVTANKALIALHGNEIFQAAQQQGVTVAFEAAVAGGIPIIKTLREGLAANRIQWIAGIINGTGNFILSEMQEKQRSFAAVLTEAQALGYAEADPSLDVNGGDAAHKLTILASIAFGVPLQFDKAYTEGITEITPADIAYADKLGYRIKHLGITRRTEAGIELRVHPCLIPQRRLLANVNGVMNAVVVNADAVGPTLYYGAGAGALPTASAVVADLVDVVRSLTTDPENRVPHLAFQPAALSNAPILPMDAVHTAYYLRLQAQDEPGVMGQITHILGEAGISIEAILQLESAPTAAGGVPIIILTHQVLEAQMNTAIAQLQALPVITDDITRIRVETLDSED